MLCAYNGIIIDQLTFCILKLSELEMPLSDSSVLKNFRSKTHSWKSHAKPNVKQLSIFHY